MTQLLLCKCLDLQNSSTIFYLYLNLILDHKMNKIVVRVLLKKVKVIIKFLLMIVLLIFVLEGLFEGFLTLNGLHIRAVHSRGCLKIFLLQAIFD